MPTTKKHREFVGEPMGDKLATDLPGIGPVLGERLAKAGFGKASAVFGQYLVLRRERSSFVHWMKKICNASEDNAKKCYKSLKEYDGQQFE